MNKGLFIAVIFTLLASVGALVWQEMNFTNKTDELQAQINGLESEIEALKQNAVQQVDQAMIDSLTNDAVTKITETAQQSQTVNKARNNSNSRPSMSVNDPRKLAKFGKRYKAELHTHGTKKKRTTTIASLVKRKGIPLISTTAHDKRPPFLTRGNAILYYSPDSEFAAKSLAEYLHDRTGIFFYVKLGVGLDVPDNQLDYLLRVCFVKDVVPES